MIKYDVIVIGGGHAGVEACNISAKLGVKTLLLTQNIKNIAFMPCNPSIGGPAKGVVVRELSALGGIMGDAADESFLQTKILNTKKGPGVWAIRNQIDKTKYHNQIIKKLQKLKNLSIFEDLVIGIHILKNKLIQIKTKKEIFIAQKIIITTGTYNSSKLMVGLKKWKGAPNNQKTSTSISSFFKKNKITLIRLDTGTPPRVNMKKVNFLEMEKHLGNNNIWTLGIEKLISKINLPCYLTYTNKKTNEVVKNNLKTSLFFHENVKTVGPARCPSIETKIVKFFKQDKHPVFLEPDNSDYSIGYLQGLNTALAKDVQQKLINTIPGLRDTKILKEGYAIEYDAIQPTQLKLTLEFKNIPNVYCAGQINGSSGYEEAAGQGIVAGINAALSIKGMEPLILNRDDSYIGTLIDDMVMKGVTEPYRLLTSMMTYRMYVRSDNAYIRLNNIAKKYNLLSPKIQAKVNNFIEKEKKLINYLKKSNLNKNSPQFKFLNYIMNIEGRNLYQSLKDARVSLNEIIKNDNEFLKFHLSKQEVEMININIKYEGYIKKEEETIKRLNKKNSLKLSSNLNYALIPNLSDGAIIKLSQYKPQTIGQARKLEKVTISDIVNLEKYISK